MKPETININARYYLQPRPRFANPPESYDVIDRALEHNHRPAVVFSNGTEKECREWLERNCDAPDEHSPMPWKARAYYYGGFLPEKPKLIAGWQIEGGIYVTGIRKAADAYLLAAAPKLLALLEQYHAAMPTKESGALIAEARGWTIRE